MCFITSVDEESYKSSGRTTDVSTEELLEIADMKLMSKEVKQCRCRTGPTQQLQHSNDLGTRGKTRRKRPKTTWKRTVEKERAEAGWRSWKEVKTERSGRTLPRPYVPRGAKSIVEVSLAADH